MLYWYNICKKYNEGYEGYILVKESISIDIVTKEIRYEKKNLHIKN